MDHASSVSHLGQDDMPNDPPKKRRRWIWAVILLAFGLLFFWVLHQHATSQDRAGGQAGAGGGGGRGGGRRGGLPGEQIPVTIATATEGSLGVYQDAIGTVTPLNTDSITSQATGVIAAVHYTRRAVCPQGRPARRYRSPSLSGTACPGAGRAGTRPESAGRSADGPEALSGSLGQRTPFPARPSRTRKSRST